MTGPPLWQVGPPSFLLLGNQRATPQNLKEFTFQVARCTSVWTIENPEQPLSRRHLLQRAGQEHWFS